ncbi:hypothetical protein P7K49_006163, partial [Saguinus oedipus]
DSGLGWQQAQLEMAFRAPPHTNSSCDHEDAPASRRRTIFHLLNVSWPMKPTLSMEENASPTLFFLCKLNQLHTSRQQLTTASR